MGFIMSELQTNNEMKDYDGACIIIYFNSDSDNL